MPGFAELALVQGMSYLTGAQEATAHNIANATTTGFKRTVPVSVQAQPRFESLLAEALPTASFTQETSRQVGEPNPTGQQNDITVLTQDRYFALREPSGNVYYARTATTRLDDLGQFTNERGDVFLDEVGQPVVLGAGDSSPSEWIISENGSITDADTLLPFGQRIGLFADVDRSLEPLGGNRFVESKPRAGNQLLPQAELVDAGNPNSEPTQLAQGFLERSNVDVTSELVQMLTVQRSFEAVSRSLGTLGRIQQSFVGAFNS